MPLTYRSRTGKTYFLHAGPRRGGGTQHFFSTKSSGTLAENLPEGFELYETVNGHWISIGEPDSMKKISSKYTKHLGRESMYDLH